MSTGNEPFKKIMNCQKHDKKMEDLEAKLESKVKGEWCDAWSRKKPP